MSNESFRFDTALNKFIQGIIWVYQAIADVVFIASLWLGVGWIQKPFIGGFLEQTLALNGSSQEREDWALYAAGFKLGDQLISINGQPVSSARDLERILDSSAIGETGSVTMRTTAGNVETADITLQSFPVA